MINKNFLMLGIVSVILLAGIAVPQALAQLDSAFPTEQELDGIGASIAAFSSTVGAVDIDTNLGGFEPHNAADLLNPGRIAVAQGNGLRVSTDFGATFQPTTAAQVPPTLGGLGYGFCGDSVLTYDSQGRLFWTYLTCVNDVNGVRLDLSITVMQVNPTTGAVIGSAIDVTPGNFSDDKPWIAADANPGGANADNIYVVWARFNTASDNALERFVLFSRSTDNGVTWSAPQAISLAAEWFTWPPHVAVGPNGDVYANYPTGTCTGTGTIQLLRDINGGADLAAGNAVQKSTVFASNQATVSCNVQAAAETSNFAPIPQTDFWLQGSYAAYTLPDPTTPGRIIVVGNDDPNNTFGNGDDGDVVMVISNDFGANWGAVTTINQNPGLQVMPIAAIDLAGNIGVTWYDNQNLGTNAGGNWLLDLYGAISTDGGTTFTEFQINDATFDPDLSAPNRLNGPPPTTRIGEYNGVAIENCRLYATWTGNDAGTFNQEIFFDAITCTGEIHGFKYEDFNANGVFDDGTDKPIKDWQICLFNAGDDPDNDLPIDCEDTDVDGLVWFEGIEFGEYQACEEVQEDWTNISEVCQKVSIDTENTDATVEFGNFKLGTIHALKYNDFNADGVFDAGTDEPIKDWQICLFNAGDDPDNDLPIDCEDTDVDGLVWFDKLVKGDYVACEEDQTEWVHTTDDCQPAAIEVSGDEDNVSFGNVRPIEAEKTWTHTDYNWGPICTLVNPEPPFNCLDERPRETDIPSDEVLAEPLPEVDDKYIAEATTNKNKVKNVTPGAFYALTTIEINVDLDSLTVDEIYDDCYDNQELIKFVSKKDSRNVKVAFTDSDKVVTELSDNIYDKIGGEIIDIDNTHAEIEITDPNYLKAGNTLYVLVKFNHDLKNESAPGNVFDEMCVNAEDVTAELLGQDAEILAEASLRITSEN